jgi:isopentenyl phosphate kinase
MKELVIVKFGGSVITTKTERKYINRRNLDLISNEIALACKSTDRSLIIVHGGGSYGHPKAKKAGFRYSHQSNGENGANVGRTIPPTTSKDALKHFSEIKTTMEELNKNVVTSLILRGVPAISFHPSDFCITNNGDISTMFTKQIELCLNNSEIPILHGDVVKDEAWGAIILSGDQILSHLAEKFKSNLSFLIVGTDVDGVFTKDPKVAGAHVRRIERITPSIFDNLKLKFTTAQFDVTGGMLKKVKILLGLTNIGVKSIIIDIKQKNVLSDLLIGGFAKNAGRGTIIEADPPQMAQVG